MAGDPRDCYPYNYQLKLYDNISCTCRPTYYTPIKSEPKSEKSLHESIVERLSTLDDLFFTDIISEEQYNTQCNALNMSLNKLASKEDGVYDV